MNPASQMRLERRLEAAALAFCATDGTLAQLRARERLDDKNFTPDGAPVKPILIATARDTGRVGGPSSPIRTLQLALTIRANSKTAAGNADAFDAQLAALELLLDSANLRVALTDHAGLRLHVFTAARTGGCNFSREGFIREQGYVLKVNAVGTEHTTA